jgi:hypothetical protein
MVQQIDDTLTLDVFEQTETNCAKQYDKLPLNCTQNSFFFTPLAFVLMEDRDQVQAENLQT